MRPERAAEEKVGMKRAWGLGVGAAIAFALGFLTGCVQPGALLEGSAKDSVVVEKVGPVNGEPAVMSSGSAGDTAAVSTGRRAPDRNDGAVGSNRTKAGYPNPDGSYPNPDGTLPAPSDTTSAPASRK